MTSADGAYPLFPIFAFVSFFLVLIPLPWHLQALNSGTCLFMIWTAIGCLNQFINSIIWHNNITDWAPVWCDISTRLIIGINIGIPASSLCINRRLYKIATCEAGTITYSQKRRAIMVDLAIGLGLPALQMALQFVVQGHRYDIWENIGCLPTTVNTPPAYPLSFVWPNIISITSAIYCVLTLRAFMLRRAQFNQFLSSNTSLTINRYFRLMCLATTEIIFTIPLSSYGLYLNVVSTPIYPWKSWSDIHFDWYQIDVFPAALWRSSRLFSVILELNRWSLVFSAVVFFGFFGFADEACRNYRRILRVLSGRFGVLPSAKSKSISQKNISLPLHDISASIPSFVKAGSSSQQRKRDSIQSIYMQNSDKESQYTETVYGSPMSPPKYEFSGTIKTPNSSRFSCATV